jgi:DNA polymerase-1
MRLVFDLEANGLYQEATKIWCVVAKDIDTQEVYTWNHLEKKKKRPDFLEKATTLICHNLIQYDLEVMKKLWGWSPKVGTEIIDSLLLSRLLNPDRRRPTNYHGKGGPHSLDCWGYRCGREKPVHDEWTKYSKEMLHRCTEDVEINYLTYLSLLVEMGEDNEWDESVALEHSMATIMTQQEINGVYFNTEQAKEYVEELTKKIETIDGELLPLLPSKVKQRGATVQQPFTTKGEYTKKYREDISYCSGPFTRVTFEPFNLGSVSVVKDYLLKHGWIADTWNFSKKTGERTSPKLEGEFRGVSGNLPTKVKERLTLRHRRSQIEGWLKHVRTDHRITAGANTCGTNTGRMRHRTVVNVPKANSNSEGLIWDTSKQKDFFGTQMRSLFCVEPNAGTVMVGHDAAGLELRMLAHYMKDKDYIEEILNGDIHTFNQQAAGLPTRDLAKSFIYALNYGAGDEKLGSLAGGGITLGRELRRTFLRTLPKLETLLRSVKRASTKGYLRGLDGRRVWMRRDPSGKVMTHKALNTLLQHSGSILMKKSSVILWDELIPQHPELQKNVKKVIDMHDESQAEVKIEYVELYCKLAVQSIVKAGEYYNLRIPMDADTNVGTTWAETH